MNYLLKFARRLGLPMIIAAVMLFLGSHSSWARSMSDAQSAQSSESVASQLNRVNEAYAEITSTDPLTSNVGGPPVGAAVLITDTQAQTLVVEAPLFTVSPFFENWGHWIRVTNYTGITQTVELEVYADNVREHPGVDMLEVNIGTLGTCEYSEGHRRAKCIFDIQPNYYWDIYIQYDLNSVADPPHWKINHCIPDQCDITHVFFPPYTVGTIYLPVIIR